MNFIYFGSSNFSLGVITALFSLGLKPQLIVSQPDQPKGRKLKITPTLTSSFALTHRIPLLRPIKLKDPDFLKQLDAYKADFYIVADYGKLLPKELLTLARFMPLCLHPSLLPYYRGAAPLNWALINGDTVSGVSIFKINEKIDCGEVLAQTKINISPADNLTVLLASFAKMGAQLLAQTLPKIIKNDYQLIAQDESKASCARKLTKADGKINWQMPAAAIVNLIRGTQDWPSAYTYYQGKLLKIIQASVVKQNVTADLGEIVAVAKEGILVKTALDLLQIKQVKLEGKEQMTAYAFALGHKLKTNDKFIDLT